MLYENLTKRLLLPSVSVRQLKTLHSGLDTLSLEPAICSLFGKKYNKENWSDYSHNISLFITECFIPYSELTVMLLMS